MSFARFSGFYFQVKALCGRSEWEQIPLVEFLFMDFGREAKRKTSSEEYRRKEHHITKSLHFACIWMLNDRKCKPWREERYRVHRWDIFGSVGTKKEMQEEDKKKEVTHASLEPRNLTWTWEFGGAWIVFRRKCIAWTHDKGETKNSLALSLENFYFIDFFL